MPISMRTERAVSYRAQDDPRFTRGLTVLRTWVSRIVRSIPCFWMEAIAVTGRRINGTSCVRIGIDVHMREPQGTYRTRSCSEKVERKVQADPNDYSSRFINRTAHSSLTSYILVKGSCVLERASWSILCLFFRILDLEHQEKPSCPNLGGIWFPPS
jgi:hypothetical protein